MKSRGKKAEEYCSFVVITFNHPAGILFTEHIFLTSNILVWLDSLRGMHETSRLLDNLPQSTKNESGVTLVAKKLLQAMNLSCIGACDCLSGKC